MLLKELNVINARGDILNLPLEPAETGFRVLDIKGTDPVKAAIVSSSFANIDGEQYHSSRREARNIIVTLGLDPDYAVMSAEELRNQLYSYLMPKTPVTLMFKLFDRFATNILDQVLDVQIAGRVESFDAPIFTSDPQVDVSIMCFNPDFVEPYLATFAGMSVHDLTESNIHYFGSVDTGVVFTFMANRAISEFTIYHKAADQIIRTADFQLDLVTGDVVTISSIRGDKYVTLLHGGVESSALFAYQPQSAWLELQEGDNSIRVYASGAPVPYKIEYYNKYGGL